MAIQEFSDVHILEKKADALLMVVDSSGRDISGNLRHWLDISQVIEMMALCKQLDTETVLDFELEAAHIFVITNDDYQQSWKHVVSKCRASDVSSINVPNVSELSAVIWESDSCDDIEVNICRR